ncbi:MAG: DUF4013 domain-containing protein [Candidatus Aenigmatarchaeota archaeon]
MINYEEALKKPFSDLGKLIVGIILSIFPIVNWVALGFSIECSGVGKNKPSSKMPEWKDLWNYFVKGLTSTVITFVYMIPALAVFSVAIGFAVGSILSVLVGQGLLSSLSTQSGEEIANIISQNWASILPTLLTATPIVFIGLVLLLIALYLSPIGVLSYLKNKNIGKAFDIGAVAKKAFTGKYMVVWILVALIDGILSSVLSSIPWLGAAVATFISGVIGWSLYGQIFREKK